MSARHVQHLLVAMVCMYCDFGTRVDRRQRDDVYKRQESQMGIRDRLYITHFTIKISLNQLKVSEK
ncbi:hypothetical protein BGV26_01595 [Clostridioides difficile]|nr:hypothetical protein BGV26_01595 [Clostridioides difficile]